MLYLSEDVCRSDLAVSSVMKQNFSGKDAANIADAVAGPTPFN